MTKRLLAPLLVLGLAVPAAGQLLTGGKLVMPAHGLSATGGVVLAGGKFSLLATLGENSGSKMAGGQFVLISGLLGSKPSARLDLEWLHVFPTPFRPAFGHDKITFRGTTTHTKIRIYTLAGWLVRTLEKNDPTTEDLIWKPVTNFAGQPLASGVYHYVAEGDIAGKKAGKLMIIK